MGANFIDFSGEERLLGMKGDWKANAELVIDDEVVAVVKKNKILTSKVSSYLACVAMKRSNG